MMSLNRLWACVRAGLPATLLAALLLGAAGVRAQLVPDPVVAAEVLVKLRSNADLPAVLTTHGLTLKARFGARPIYRLGIVGSTPVATKITELLLDPAVLLADANSRHDTPEARKNMVWAIGSPQAYANQWAPASMRLPSAHRYTKGAGVRIAVLDTGVDTGHPALQGRLLPGFDFVDFDADPSERGTPTDLGYGHGTHVAGIVALVAPQARIMPIRVLDPQGQGNAWVLGEALLYAVDPDGNPATDDGAHVINLSLGSVNRTGLMKALSDLATCSFVALPDPLDDFTDPGYNGDRDRCAARRGVVVVAAAGNGGNDNERQYPAAEGAYGLVAVAASNAALRVANFSNSGSWIEVAAPGDLITSAAPGGGYATWSGTSMAAPMVAGTAALLISVEPGLDARDVARRLERSGDNLCGNARQSRLDAAVVLRMARSARMPCP
jgi:subtilisin family serine protease